MMLCSGVCLLAGNRPENFAREVRFSDLSGGEGGAGRQKCLSDLAQKEETGNIRGSILLTQFFDTVIQ
jgi:hypothetical protein